MGYLEDEFGNIPWDLVDKKAVRSRGIVFMEEKKIEDWKQPKSKPGTYPTVTTIPADHTGSTKRRQPFETVKPEMINSELPRSTDKLESTNPEQPIDIYESNRHLSVATCKEIQASILFIGMSANIRRILLVITCLPRHYASQLHDGSLG